MECVVVMGLLNVTALLLGATAEQGSPRKPAGLLVQLLRHPEQALITSPLPRFSWMVNDRARGAVQTAYQVQVASSRKQLEAGTPDVWDSGKVSGAASVGVAYAGKPLPSNTSYWWRVRTWNASGKASAYSKPQQFHVGDLDAARAAPSESRWCRLRRGADGGWALENRQAMYIEEREPATFVKKGKNRYFVDFGKAAFGKLQVTIALKQKEAAIRVHAGEKAKGRHSVDRHPGGNIAYRAFTLNARRGTHRYLLEPERHRRGLIPLPDHLGEVFPFRYAEFVDCPCPLTRKDVAQQVVVYPFDDEAASFSSSDQTLNEVWELCKYTMKATNFLGIFIDGERERLPYEADAYINQLGYCCCDREYAISRYTHEYLIHHPTWPTEWILQSPFLAWADYMYTGHPDSLQKYYDDLQAKTLLPLAREDGLISTLCLSPNLQEAFPEYTPSEIEIRRAREVLESIHLGKDLNDIVDWPKGERDGYVFMPVNTVVNAFHYGALRILADIARVLNKPGDAERYRAAAEKVRQVFNARLFDPVRGLYVDGEGTDHVSLHGNLFPLALGLVPEDRKSGVVAYLRGKGMACSVYAAQWLLDAVYDSGEADYGFALMTDTHTDRSWPHMIRNVGSTITLEAWDMKYKPNADWNHAWGAAPANIIPRKLMGIEPLAPGFETVRIRPQPGPLAWATITMPTIRGPITLAYRRETSAVHYDVRIPANMRAEIHLPTDKPDRVTESGKPATDAAGVEYLRQENGRAVFRLGAGEYALCIRQAGMDRTEP